MRAPVTIAISLIFGPVPRDIYWKTYYALDQNSLEQLVYRPRCLYFADSQKVLHELYSDLVVLYHIRLERGSAR